VPKPYLREFRDDVVRVAGQGDAAEVRELRRRNRLAAQENEVRCGAVAYLSQANLKLGQSPKRRTRWSVN